MSTRAILLCSIAAALLLLPTKLAADMRGEVVCGVPPEEAGMLTAVSSSGTWTRSTTEGAAVQYSASEQEAANIALNQIRVCEVEVKVNFRVTRGVFYRLGRPLAKYTETADAVYAGDFDVRALIVGVSGDSECDDSDSGMWRSCWAYDGPNWHVYGPFFSRMPHDKLEVHWKDYISSRLDTEKYEFGCSEMPLHSVYLLRETGTAWAEDRNRGDVAKRHRDEWISFQEANSDNRFSIESCQGLGC